MNKQVLVYFNEDAIAPKGGPAAVCYYYYQEQKQKNEHRFDFLPSGRGAKRRKVKKKWYSKGLDNLHILGAIAKMLYLKPRAVSFDFLSYDLIHFHSTDSLYQARTSLEVYTGKVLLQSHSPEPRGREMFAALPAWIRVLCPFFKRGFEKMDRYAFNRADYLLFPCVEAEEPYYHTWPYFKTIHEIKPNAFKYVLTGIPVAKANRGRNEILLEQGIPGDSFILSYVGRHNQIKGYDILKEIGSKYLEEDKESWILCAGMEAPLKGLPHHRWREIGWTTDPHSYISASDVFILPNRETYFDIIMMELLSLGKIVIASRTGGNKWFAKNHCPGVFLYDSTENALNLIRYVRSLPVEERNRLGDDNKKFYQDHLTVARMYDSYICLLDELLG